MKLFALVLALSLAACCSTPAPPTPPVHTATTNPCVNTPWLGYARLGPINSSGGYYIFAVPQSSPTDYYRIENNMFFNEFDGHTWTNQCGWPDPFNYANGGSPRYYDSMFYIWGAYAKIWLKVYNSGTRLYECWMKNLGYDFTQYDCGLMDLDSYSNAVWSTPVYN